MPELPEIKKIKNKYFALFWAILMVFSASANGILIKSALNLKITDPLNFICQSILFAAAILVFILLLRGKGSFLNIAPKSIFNIAIAGLLGTAANYSLLALGLERTTAINFAFLSQAEIVFVVLLGFIFLKEKINFKKIILVLTIISGIYLVTTGGAPLLFKKGDLLIVAATFFFSLGVVISKDVLKKVPALVFSAYRNLFGGLFLSIYIFSTGKFAFNPGFLWPVIVGAILAVTVLSTSKVLFYASASYMTIISTAIVAVTAVAAWLFLNETIGIVQAIGGGLILVSVYFANKMNI